MITKVVNLDRLANQEDSVGDALLDGELFSGIAFEVHPVTGTVTGVAGYRYGKRHGAWREWDASGRPTDEEYFEVGGPRGPVRKWHRNGQLAESEHYEHLTMTRSTRWDDNGKLLQEYRLRDTAPEWVKLQTARNRNPRLVIDIDLATLTFFERPEGWGRNESDLPPPQPPPSLELCRALESQSLAKR